MDAHVDEQFVTGVERTVASRASGPETGEVVSTTHVHVAALDVRNQRLLTVEDALAIPPAALEQLGRRRRRRRRWCHRRDAAVVTVHQHPRLGREREVTVITVRR